MEPPRSHAPAVNSRGRICHPSWRIAANLSRPRHDNRVVDVIGVLSDGSAIGAAPAVRRTERD
jgi:hypothetical protein